MKSFNKEDLEVRDSKDIECIVFSNKQEEFYSQMYIVIILISKNLLNG
jgi:hypothetical protein